MEIMRSTRLYRRRPIVKWLAQSALMILFLAFSMYDRPAFSFDAAANVPETARREFTVTGRYLNLPVKSGAPMRRITLTIDGETVRYFNIELAENDVEFWTFTDISTFKGSRMTIQGENVPAGSNGFAIIYQGDEIKEEDSFYREKLRPQFHFSSRRGWNNDPNGLVWYDGEYHLFYQHNPFGWNWGNMHWGHAVSRDLIHWEELSDALYPDELGTMFSGSAAIDHENTSGFRTGTEQVMVAAYTADAADVQTQCIAYSNDRGRTWTKYENNPVLGDRREIIGSRNDRDPKIFRHEPTGKWILALFERMGISIFTSDNLKEWKYESHTEGFWECPELFELAVDGNPSSTKWVMYGASGTYMIGSFDGKRFTPETGKLYYHEGVLYAAQTYNNAPNGRRIQIGWGRVPMPGMPFNQMMLFPSELSLRTTDEGIRLFTEPVPEIDKLHGKKYAWSDIEITGEDKKLLQDVSGDLLHIKAEFEPYAAPAFGMVIHGYKLAYDMNHNRLNGTFLAPDGNKVYLEILVDRNSVEVYANHGRLYKADVHNSVDSPRGLSLFSNGNTKLNTLEIYELKSIWN